MTIKHEIMIKNLREWLNDSCSGDFITQHKSVVAKLLAHIDAQSARIAELEKQYEDRTPTQWAYDQACAALEKHRERANLAEKELSSLADVAGSNAARVKELERELAALRAKEPDGYIFCHPAGRLFWDVSDESKKDHKDVKPFYFNPSPVAVPSDCSHEWISSEGRTTSGWLCNRCGDYNGPDPVVVPDEKQALIKDASEEIEVLDKHIARLKKYGDTFNTDSYESQLARQKIALASLTAEPVGWRYRYLMPHMKNVDGTMGWVGNWKLTDDISCCNKSKGYEIEDLFTTPPVPEVKPSVVKLPGCVDDLHGVGPVMSAEDVIRAIKDAGGSVEDE